MHTEGPWQVDGPYARITYIRTRPLGQAGSYVIVARIYGDDDQVWPDAHLIAAAPDLLAACKAALKDVDVGMLSSEVTDAMIAAIAKAEGRGA